MCSPFHLTCRLLNNLCKLQIRSRQISISDLQKKLESAVTFFFFSQETPRTTHVEPSLEGSLPLTAMLSAAQLVLLVLWELASGPSAAGG